MVEQRIRHCHPGAFPDVASLEGAQCSRMAMYSYCQGTDLSRSRGAKIIEDGLDDFFSFVCQAFQYLLKNFHLCT